MEVVPLPFELRGGVHLVRHDAGNGLAINVVNMSKKTERYCTQVLRKPSDKKAPFLPRASYFFFNAKAFFSMSLSQHKEANEI